MVSLISLSAGEHPAKFVVEPLQRSDRLMVWALAAMLAADVVIFLYATVAGFVRQPFSDMFDFLNAEFDFERSGDLAAYLMLLHNGQHLVWVRVLTALDIHVFHGTSLVFVAAASLSVLFAAALVGLEIVRSTSVRTVGALGALIAAPLIASTVNAVDCTQPINSVYAVALVFVVAAIILFERAAAETGMRAILLAGAALIAGLAATGGSAAGVAVFPVLTLSAIRNANARWLLPFTVVAAVAACAVVFSAVLANHPISSSAAAPGHLLKMADYFVVYAGLPWSIFGPLSHLRPVRLMIGLAVIVVGMALLARGSRREGAAGRLERIGLDLILFALITGALAAVGRVDETEAENVPLRYAIFMSAFQVGVICALAPALAEHWANFRPYAVPAVLVVALAVLGAQTAAISMTLSTSQLIRVDIAAFTAGQRRADLHRTIHPDFNLAGRIQAECRRRGLYQ
jgi:hypothetical protein